MDGWMDGNAPKSRAHLFPILRERPADQETTLSASCGVPARGSPNSKQLLGSGRRTDVETNPGC